MAHVGLTHYERRQLSQWLDRHSNDDVEGTIPDDLLPRWTPWARWLLCEIWHGYACTDGLMRLVVCLNMLQRVFERQIPTVAQIQDVSLPALDVADLEWLFSDENVDVDTLVNRPDCPDALADALLALRERFFEGQEVLEEVRE